MHPVAVAVLCWFGAMTVIAILAAWSWRDYVNEKEEDQ